MAGFLGEKAAEMFEEVMENHDIHPGELLERIEKTLNLIDEFKPVAEEMAETSSDIDDNIGDLRTEINQFNENTREMTEAMDELSDTLEKFHGLFEEVDEN